MCTFKFQNYQQQLQYTAVKSSRPAALQPAAATPPAESSWDQPKSDQPNTVSMVRPPATATISSSIENSQ